MFERPHHQRIHRLLQSLDGQLLTRCRCYFSGGTAIVLNLREYRESQDIRFLCDSREGYETLRSIILERGIEGLFLKPPKVLTAVRAGPHCIRACLGVDDIPIPFEIAYETRIPLTGFMRPDLGVPRLTRANLFTFKLLANADRHSDPASASRDIIDLAMMTQRWGPPPMTALHTARGVYGDMIRKACTQAINILQHPEHGRICLETLKMDMALLPVVRRAMYRVYWN